MAASAAENDAPVSSRSSGSRKSSHLLYLVAAVVVSAVGLVHLAQAPHHEHAALAVHRYRAEQPSGQGGDGRQDRGAQEAWAQDVVSEHTLEHSLNDEAEASNLPPAMAAAPPAINGRKYHVVVSTDGNHYTTWQTRIMYYWYKRAKEQHPDSDIGGFTRLLHSGRPDKYMEEMPTVVVSGLGHMADRNYPVLNRPFAFKQWLSNLSIAEDYILMAEPDHLMIKPPPNWATEERPAGYPFTYMDPRKFPRELNQFSRFAHNKDFKDAHLHMDPLGNSPVIIHKDQLKRIAPLWTELALEMKRNSAVNRAFGWIQEMYAFSLASAIVDEQPIRYDMHMEFLVQPPWDADLRVRCWPVDIIARCPLKDVFIIHYTYGMDVDRQGQFTPGRRGYWHWDKRDYISGHVPIDIPPPPKGTGSSIVRLVAMINEAAQALWPSGRT